MQTCANDFHTSMMIQASDLTQAVLERRDDDTENEHFGEGYAKSNAALIGRVLQAGLIDYVVRMFSRRYGQREPNERYILDGLSDSCRLETYKVWKKEYCRENPNADPEQYNQAAGLIINSLGV